MAHGPLRHLPGTAGASCWDRAAGNGPDGHFAQDIREVTMEARDTTVHILKKFGAETTGAPFSFYRGTVTPMRLTREAFWNSHTGGQI